MKVVITTEYGFEISREGWLWLLDHGFDPYEEFHEKHGNHEYTFDNSWFTDENQAIQFEHDKAWHDECNAKYNLRGGEYWYKTLDEYLNGGGCSYLVNIPRHHPLLIQMIEELGERANPQMDFNEPIERDGRGLKIVEIPDGIHYEVIDPDGGGTEYIQEVLDIPARTWS